jgi:hypothetical protein
MNLVKTLTRLGGKEGRQRPHGLVAELASRLLKKSLWQKNAGEDRLARYVPAKRAR